MKKLKNLFIGDPIIWWCFFALSIVSAVFVFSSIGTIVRTGSPVVMWLKHHMLFILLGWVAVLTVSHINYRKFAKWAMPLLGASVLLLVVVLCLPGSDTKRWLELGGVRFQPSEIAKIGLVLYMAKLLATNTDKLNDLGFFLKLIFVMGVVAGLIVTENFSTAALVSIICFLMMFFGGVNLKYWWRTAAIVALLGGLFLTVKYVNFKADVDSGKVSAASEASVGRGDTWAHRVYTWVQNDKEELNQINMSRMAIACGGLTGVGVGNTVIARVNTQMHSDFIFSTILEEGGFLMGLFVFLVYAWMCARCIKMANRCQGTFGSLLLGGLGIYIFVQALVHMAYNVGAIPVTGQTLPLVSHGGTSYVMFAIAIGMMQSVCNDVRKKERAEREAAERQRGFEETFEIAKENA